MRKVILLSKRSSALSQDLNAEPRSLGFRRTRATKKVYKTSNYKISSI
ncbi:hypothetical protein HID58_088901 [Brassica napus]|uniref:Uncharacterized protein n=1 Tax=Brassica napus TaxID=3708 RepID=A0ABQ7Y0G6_BRANA|nr:hypothetical protein HID58_088901 [Brassica napus]